MPKLNLNGFPFSFLHLIRLTEVVLVIALIVVLADLTWKLFPPPQGKDIFTEASSKSDSKKTNDNLSTIDEPSAALKALFGHVKDSSAVATARPVRETQLKLTLKGILMERDSEKKLALIERSNKMEKVYRPGDTIEGAEIIAIEPGRVILRRNGVNESLTLKVQKLNRVSTSSFASKGGKNGVRKISDNRLTVSKEALNTQLKNLPKLLKQAKTVAHKDNGQEVGFRVVQINNGSLFHDLGIKQDDIVRSVNGNYVRNAKEAMKAYQQLRTASVFNVDLLRDGREVTINYSVQ